ncbi:MAG: hypothetical protein II857_01160 [Selenomonadaceae bacterium]|nr:hypothetical protein [Selenomonadaceae bacterium]
MSVARRLQNAKIPARYAGTTLCKVIDAQSYNGSRIVDRCREVSKPILLKGKSTSAVANTVIKVHKKNITTHF